MMALQGLLLCLLLAFAVGASPDGPSQQCADDAGPPWVDDNEVFEGPYHHSWPAAPVLPASGCCPAPLQAACVQKGVKRAHLDGPIDCGGAGWFCRIVDQEDWKSDYGDKNFGYCDKPNGDETDQDGHCHGGLNDDTYGWWVRDHWWRGYPGTLHCCCGWADGTMHGLVNRCDFRKQVLPKDLATCRDANEEHKKGTVLEQGYAGTCAKYAATHPFKEPVVNTPDKCWTVKFFSTGPDGISTKDDEGLIYEGNLPAYVEPAYPSTCGSSSAVAPMTTTTIKTTASTTQTNAVASGAVALRAAYVFSLSMLCCFAL